MGTWAQNNASDVNNKVDYQVRGEHISDGVFVPSLDATITIPARNVLDFHALWLVADGINNARPWIAQAPQIIPRLLHLGPPANQFKRVIGCWGTEPDAVALIRQTQTDRLVQYSHDYEFNPDLMGRYWDTVLNQWVNEGFFTNNTWLDKGAEGGFPPLLCQAFRCRLEAKLINTDKPYNIALAQVNVASIPYPTSLQFKTQGKGLCSLGQPDVSHDNVRCVSVPGSDRFGVHTGPNCRGFLMFSGYELLPT